MRLVAHPDFEYACGPSVDGNGEQSDGGEPVAEQVVARVDAGHERHEDGGGSDEHRPKDAVENAYEVAFEFVHGFYGIGRMFVTQGVVCDGAS